MSLKRYGLAGIAAAIILSGPAYAEQVKREGVIISADANGYQVRTREGPITVVVPGNAKIRQTKGLSSKTRSTTDLIPGLIIKVDGDQQGSTVTASKVEFRESDWRNAIATKAGTVEQFDKAAAERAQLRQAIIDGNEYVIQAETTVYFASGSSAISQQYKTQLRELAQKAPGLGNYRVSVLGFADPVGNAAANERLSLKRAGAVSNYLRQTGLIQPGRVLSPSAMGEGTTAPEETAPTNNQGARRVLVRLVTPKTQLTQ